MQIETKTFLFTLIFGLALIGIGIVLLRYKKASSKDAKMNYRLCGIFSLALGILFCIYRTLIFFIPSVAELAGLFIFVGLIVVNIVLFRYWKKRKS